MRTPTLHLNGTSRAELLDQVTSAADALRTAIEALQGAAPNARDYYPQGPSAFAEAAQEHAARMARLQAVRQELCDISEAIAD